MRKWMVGALTAALVLTLGSTALAAGHGAGWRQADRTDCPWCGAGCAYVDAAGDGVCANRPGGGAIFTVRWPRQERGERQ